MDRIPQMTERAIEQAAGKPLSAQGHKSFEALRGRVARFAAEEIAGRSDTGGSDRFPWDLWRRMAEEGLLGICLPSSCGGGAGSVADAVVALKTLTARGGNMGMAFSMAIHLLTSRLLLEYGSEEHHGTILPKMAAGELTASLAVSEPGVAAHPAKLAAAARFENGTFILDGEKVYISNGPIADLFIVIAQTALEGGRKRFSAFLVPRGAYGLILSEPMDVGFLKPSPHCSLRLEGCRIPESSLLGTMGSAYEAVAIPFREREDVYLAALITGGMEHQMELLLDGLRRSGSTGSSDSTAASALPQELKAQLGELRGLIHALELLALEAARASDCASGRSDAHLLDSAFRSIARHTQSVFDRAAAAAAAGALTLPPDSRLDLIANDVRRTLSIARSAVFLRQAKAGNALLQGGS